MDRFVRAATLSVALLAWPSTGEATQASGRMNVPHEYTNLAGDPNSARTLVRLRRLLSDAKARAGWVPAVP